MAKRHRRLYGGVCETLTPYTYPDRRELPREAGFLQTFWTQFGSLFESLKFRSTIRLPPPQTMSNLIEFVFEYFHLAQSENVSVFFFSFPFSFCGLASRHTIVPSPLTNTHHSANDRAPLLIPLPHIFCDILLRYTTNAVSLGRGLEAYVWQRDGVCARIWWEQREANKPCLPCVTWLE